MLKITTRIFTASALGAMLIGMNTGAFACDDHSPAAKVVTTKVAAKGAKPVAKVVANAKVAPKIAKASGVKLASLQVAGAKTATAKAAPMMCPMCAKEHAGEKK